MPRDWQRELGRDPFRGHSSCRAVQERRTLRQGEALPERPDGRIADRASSTRPTLPSPSPFPLHHGPHPFSLAPTHIRFRSASHPQSSVQRRLKPLSKERLFRRFDYVDRSSRASLWPSSEDHTRLCCYSSITHSLQARSATYLASRDVTAGPHRAIVIVIRNHGRR